MATTVTDVRPEGQPPDAPEAEPEPPGRPLDVTRLVAIGLPVLLVLVAGVLRFTGLGEPGQIYFDETYYANDANQYLTRGVEVGFAVHPPIGKWLIAAGIQTFGFDSYGWRVASAAAGTLQVLVLYLAAVRLFRRRGIAALAALLLAVEGLALTMSRIAMLDVFLALFVTIGFWLLLVDRDQQWAGADVLARAPAVDEDGKPVRRALPRRGHLYRALAGLAFGLGLATKWSALLAIGAAGLFVLVSELTWRQRVTGRWYVGLERIVASGLATLVLLPVLVYALSHVGWFASYENTRKGMDRCRDTQVCADVPAGTMVADWYAEQREIANFHRTLTAEHPYRAPATSWPLMRRPVAYYFESCDDPANPPENGCQVSGGNVAEILGMGNPLIWWSALLALPALLVLAVVRLDWRAWTIPLFLLFQYLPWMATTRPVFIFYATPAMPFLCLTLAYVAWRALEVRSLRWVPAVVAAIGVVGFLFFLPVFVGIEVPRDQWDLRIWMQSWI